MTPLISFEGNFINRMIARFTSKRPFSRLRIGWGKGCIEDETVRGRAGICHFFVGQVNASNAFGKIAAKEASNLKTDGLIQFVGVKKDPVVSNDAMQQTYDNLPKGTKKSLCFIKEGANHSLLSRFDAPDEDKYWIDALTRQLLNAFGQKQAIPNEQIDGTSICQI